MLDVIVTTILISVGLVFGLFILTYAVHIAFFPLGETIGGGVEALKGYAHQKDKRKLAEQEYDSTWVTAALLRLVH